MADWKHDPTIKYGYDILKQLGGEQTDLGRQTTAQGVGILGPVSDYFRRLLGGDTNALMQAIGPEADIIGQQFNAIRQMISQQPRGGGKTSQLAQLPIEQSRELSGLVGQARRGAPAGLEQIAGLLSQLGEQETGRGFAAGPELAQIGLYGRQQDYEQSWGRFFKQLAVGAVGGAGEGLGLGIAKHFKLF